jgi:adenylate cyclase
MRKSAPPLVDPLLARAEIEAERTTGWVRVAIGVTLAGGFMALAGMAPAGAHIDVRHPLILVTIVGFIGLGATSLIVVAAGRYVPWLAFLFAAGDAAIIAFAIWASLRLGQFSGNWIAAVPAIWAAPLILTVGALRYRPAVQLWTTALLMLGLLIVAGDLGFQARLTPRDPGVLDAVPYRPPGWEFGPLRAGADRAGFVLARGESRAEALGRTEAAADRIRFLVD